MKTITLTMLLLSAFTAHAFEVDLQQYKRLNVQEMQELVDAGADSFKCVENTPRCILKGAQYGILYEGQNINNVHLTHAVSVEFAFTMLKKFKDQGLCK